MTTNLGNTKHQIALLNKKDRTENTKLRQNPQTTEKQNIAPNPYLKPTQKGR